MGVVRWVPRRVAGGAAVEARLGVEEVGAEICMTEMAEGMLEGERGGVAVALSLLVKRGGAGLGRRPAEEEGV